MVLEEVKRFVGRNMWYLDAGAELSGFKGLSHLQVNPLTVVPNICAGGGVVNYWLVGDDFF
jgi:hypothetical protein